MANPFVAEIRVFPFNFQPVNWAFCDGGLMPISRNTALFSLLGTQFGGDGRSTFGLPNMQASMPIGQGQGSGLQLYVVGESGGSQTVTLLQTELPTHFHNMVAADSLAARPNAKSPANAAMVYESGVTNMYTTATAPVVQMASQALPPQGNNLPHNNLMPYLTLNFCISLAGVFPPRS